MADSSDNTNRTYYDDFAGWYERERGRGYHGMIDDLEIDAVLPLARHQNLLEVGCGTGLILSRLRDAARTARGIDISPGMVQKARERGLDVVLGSATALPFRDESFDFVCSFKVLAHIPDIGKALSEIARVTKPGGKMALEFYNPLSLRYLSKRIAGPQKISEGRTEADVYTRWDAPFVIPRVLPPGVRMLDAKGVRVLTPAAFVHKIPGVGKSFEIAEKLASQTPLRWFGGFLIAVLEKQA